MEDIQLGTRFIAVIGEAEIMATPDEAVAAFGVETVNNDLNKAKEENDEIVNRLISTTKELGINSSDIQTDYLEIEPKHERFENRYEFLGYYVRKSIAITIKDTSQLEKILTAALEIGVNHVHDIKFQTTKLKGLRDKARSLAIKAAQAKAEALSQDLNLKVGKPLSIEEEISGVRLRNNSWWGSHYRVRSQNMAIFRDGDGLESSGSIAPGQIAVGAKIKVRFEIG